MKLFGEYADRVERRLGIRIPMRHCSNRKARDLADQLHSLIVRVNADPGHACIDLEMYLAFFCCRGGGV